jgi:hypothetical protein
MTNILYFKAKIAVAYYGKRGLYKKTMMKTLKVY